MHWFRFLFTLLGLVLVGIVLWYYYDQYVIDSNPSDFTENVAEESDTEENPQISELPELFDPSLFIQYPEGAIRDEMVIHFRDRADYLKYLGALAGAGYQPIGQIDELLAVRISTDSLRVVDPSLFESERSFSYLLERPPAPVEIAPEAFASLQAYGQSARSIVGGLVDGGDGTGVLVGILDSGIVPHAQFDDTYIVNIDLVGGGVGGPGAQHGTSVASIISGSEGIAPEAELFVVRVLDDEGIGTSYDVAQGIIQAVDMGVDVLNMSLGVYQDVQILRDAVSYANQQGVILVAAAGNDAYTQLPFPAAYPSVISVTAVDARGQQALFPNQSESINFAAPGVGIITANEEGGTIPFSGTSAAAPFVSGTLAAMLSADTNMSSQQAVELLQRHLNEAGSSGPDPVYGGGLVDWDRLRERGQPGLLDVAVADIHLASDATPGTMMPIEVTVQNRGTSWLASADLEVMLGEDEPMAFTVGSLSPGQITSRKVFTQVPSLGSDETLQIGARVLPPEIESDIRLQNNLKVVTYRPRN
ncbi:MAG: S8 family serine peptidase [Verrucomicrobiota bacterium]